MIKMLYNNFAVTHDTHVITLGKRFVELETDGHVIRDYRPGVIKWTNRLVVRRDQISLLNNCIESIISTGRSWCFPEGRDELSLQEIQYMLEEAEEELENILYKLQNYF